MPQENVVIGNTYQIRRAEGRIVVRITGTNDRGFNAVDVATGEETTVAATTRMTPFVVTETPAAPRAPRRTTALAVTMPTSVAAQEIIPVTTPTTRIAITAPAQTFKPAFVAALIEFKRSNPWRGTVEERQQKFSTLHEKVKAAYNIPLGLSFEEIDPLAGNGASRFGIDENKITLAFKLSVVTYLVAIGVARGFDQSSATKWAQAAYQRFFPISAERHRQNDHGMMVPA